MFKSIFYCYPNEMNAINQDIITAVIVGIGLSAACGFRVFVPMLVVSIAGNAGYLQIIPEFSWLTTNTAIIAFSIATILEVCAYYIPWVDNLMDSISFPASVIAGTILTYCVIADLSPFYKWTFAIIAGGGTAATIQGASVLARSVSVAITVGIGNFIISTIELFLSILIAILAIFLPLLCFVILLFIFYKAIKILSRKFSCRVR